ncbi:tyrosine-type recombinase/integrase [Streptomyces sp. NPDC059761]|uniref:tyrosine-type recombinase/integrase n=1 Tax=Streptomyces sp. NPDC059761 TaxID=3346937 RepID=UPI003653F675
MSLMTVANTDLVVAPAGTLRTLEEIDRDRRICEEIERQWLLEFKKANTQIPYRRNVDSWFDWCFDNAVSPLAARREHSAQWSADLAEALAPSSVNQHLSAMNSWYDFGLDDYEHAFRIERSPWRKKHRQEVSDESQTLGLDKAEAQSLAAMSWEYGSLDAAVVETLLGTGMRSGELEAAQIKHLGRSRGRRTLRILRKRSKWQTLALPPKAEKGIDLHLAARPHASPNEPLILCHDGMPLTNRRIDVMIKRCCRAARIEKVISPHGLRHTCATLMLDAGVSLRMVQRILGHSNPATTNRYDLARNDLDGSPVFRLAEFLLTA